MELVGRVILYVGALPVAQTKGISVSVNTGTKAVKGMAPNGLPIGTVAGTPEFTIDCDLYIPEGGEAVSWRTLQNAVLIVRPREGLVGPRFIFTGVFVMEMGLSFSEESEATRKVKLGALAMLEVD